MDGVLKGSENSLQKDIADLRNEVRLLRSLFADQSADSSQKSQDQKQELRVFFEKNQSERKPFQVKIDGIISAKLKLSAIRAAILLILFLDLEDKSKGGQGLLDTKRAMETAYKAFEGGKVKEESIQDRIRVALFRFNQLLEEKKPFENEQFSLDFKPDSISLVASHQGSPLSFDFLELEVITGHPEISEVLDLTLTTSPLARVRKQKAMFVPPGQHGYDRLLLEFFDHSLPVSFHGIFTRPTVQSYPTELLEQLDVSANKVQRVKIVKEAFISQRLSFTEILNRKTVWDMIRLHPNGGFTYYSPHIDSEDALRHLEHWIALLNSHPTYRLALSDAHFPFILGSCEIATGAIPDYFTLFFQNSSRDELYRVGSFVVHDANVFHTISERVVQWVLSHPSTTIETRPVIKELEAVKAHLLNHGPLQPGEAAPS